MARLNYCLLFTSQFFFHSLVIAQINCSTNWLNNKNTLAGVQIGSLNVTGNNITVEALINSTYANPGGRLYAGDIVSKHFDANSTNYLLRPSSTEITTTNGYFITPKICDISLNKTYHVAMVYDGIWLRFYRNGYLMSQVAASGNLIQNNYQTMIGEFAGYPSVNPEAFVGFIDEVRIWNTARTQSEIQSFMNVSIPNPSNQTGLLAYYSFYSLKNLQGNTNWDGVLIGNASIQTSNPTCNNFVSDSCEIFTLPTLIKSNDTTICLGKSAFLNANTTNALSFKWTPQTGLSNSTISNPVATPVVTTKYYVSINSKDSRGLNITLKDSILVQVTQKPSFSLYPSNGIVCLGDSILLTASGGNNYKWNITPDIQNLYSPSVWVKPTVTSSYNVLITETNCGFAETLQSIITLNQLPVVTISKTNDIDCSNSYTNLIATGGSAYSWTPINGLSNASISNPKVQTNQTTTYIAKVIGDNSCISYDSITVIVSNINQSLYYIPNSFTPNNDGLNDSFGIKDWGYTTKFSFSIFNRWGELIFFSSDPLKRWDGNVKGIPQESGVFIYNIKAETLCGSVEKNGTVLLIR